MLRFDNPPQSATLWGARDDAGRTVVGWVDGDRSIPLGASEISRDQFDAHIAPPVDPTVTPKRGKKRQ